VAVAIVKSSEAPKRGAFWWVPYLYLLRVHLITAALLVFLPPLARSSPLLNGLFDLDFANTLRSAGAMVLVSTASFATAWTLLATSWCTVYNAPERYGVERIAWVRFPITWPERIAFGFLGLSPIVNAIQHSWQQSGVPRLPLWGGALAGLGVAVAALLWTNRTAAWLQRDVHQPSPRSVMGRQLRRLVLWLAARPNIREGFIDAGTTHLRDGHMIAWVAFCQTVTLYLLIGAGKYVAIGRDAISTLACVLLLILMLCWILAGTAFFVDRYRLPVLVAVCAVPFVTAWLPWSDHFYRTVPRYDTVSPMPSQVLNLGSEAPILVAATGGGIQASAWTAQVLAGLASGLPAELQEKYARSIRMISTVSGGGVGAMYFLEKYHNGVFVPGDLADVVKRAEASSLDDVAWGAAYPDLVRLFLPLPFRWARIDRGQALEWAWTRNADVARTLADWRADVWSDNRPATIFNATIADTGERMLIGTTRIGWRRTPGFQNFEDTYPHRDVQVVTAARLAASFTYVSPAVRTDGGGPTYHLVDGGYHDDYGMMTLTEWLDEALQGAGGQFPRVLVIQIRSSPEDEDDHADTWHGWFYQAWVPLETLLNVRTSGQLSHNDEEFARLQRLWRERGVEVDTAVFRFCGDHPPLSWHMTGREKEEIQARWAEEQAGPAAAAVRAYLEGQPIPGATRQRPFDAPVPACTAR
jgi:hypothetical protein